MNEPFIMDLGESLTLTYEDGHKEQLPRYGVWEWDRDRRKYQVTCTSNSLDDLKKKYPTAPMVLNLPKPR